MSSAWCCVCEIPDLLNASDKVPTSIIRPRSENLKSLAKSSCRITNGEASDGLKRKDSLASYFSRPIGRFAKKGGRVVPMLMDRSVTWCGQEI